MNELPFEVLAQILRQSLDPVHPGSLLCRSYRAPLSFGPFDRDPFGAEKAEDRRRHSLLAAHFSLESLRRTRQAWRLPAVIVCKLWRRAVQEGDVVRVLATRTPHGVPPSVRVLLLHLDTLSSRDPSLHSLWNALSSSGLPRLQKVVCSSPDIQDSSMDVCRDNVHDLLPELRSLPRGLAELDISGSQLDAERFGSHVTRLSSLQSLEMSLVDVNHSGFRALAPALGRLTNLTRLSLQCNDIGHPKAAHGLLKSLECLTALQDLDLSDIGLGNVNTKLQRKVAGALWHLTALRSLKLAENDFVHSWFYEDLGPHLAHLPHLHTLSVGECYAGDLLPLIKGARALRHLQAALYCPIPLPGAPEAQEDGDGLFDVPAFTAFAAQLAKLPLLILDLRHSRLGHEDEEAPRLLAAQLLSLSSLQTLNLSNACLDAGSAAVLMRAVSQLSDLRTLRLSGERHMRNGMPVLGPCLAALTALGALDPSSTGIADDSSSGLARVLERLSRLQVLSLGSNELSASGVRALAPSLRGLCALRHLVVDGNPIGDEGALELASLSLTCVYMHTLGLGDCSTSPDGEQAVRDACVAGHAPHLLPMFQSSQL